MTLLIFLIISVLAAYGIAIAIVEKGDEWPIEPWKEKLRFLIACFSWKATDVLQCTICLSFWTTLITDICLFFISEETYFLWPLSGFITVGLSFTIYELLYAIESKQENDEEEIEA